jgi:Histidine kinase-, DNA gyrase B-, and HSP90-like ATPase
LQGRSPLPCALAELIDNSLQALLPGNASGEKHIAISLLVSGTSKGLISVWDNGVGMDKRQLNEWAVMNLAMEDRDSAQSRERGDLSTNPRFITGNLSYFGVWA